MNENGTSAQGSFFRRLRYPKFILLALTFLLAYLIFSSGDFLPLREALSGIGYLGSFLCGIGYSYGFTAAPATAILLLISKSQNIFLASVLGGLGSLIADLFIFKVIRHSLRDEIERLSSSSSMTKIRNRMPASLKKYLVPSLAVFIIASPLPDEVGVTMFAACTNIRTKTFSLISFVLNTLGIFVVLSIGNAI
jgi:uncharacterized membrane protein YdjX (TVP38/TMEM64 family)